MRFGSFKCLYILLDMPSKAPKRCDSTLKAQIAFEFHLTCRELPGKLLRLLQHMCLSVIQIVKSETTKIPTTHIAPISIVSCKSPPWRLHIACQRLGLSLSSC